MFSSILLLTPVELPLWSLELIAQAGGGGSYGGGGGGGGGGDSGGIEAVVWLIYLTIKYPAIGIPVWIVIGLLSIFGKKTETNARINRTIRRGRRLQEEQLRDSGTRRIQQRDPDFQEATFLKRVINGFLTTQHAWSEQDLRKCRAFISDGIRERFELYISMQKAENIRNRMRDVEVQDASVVSVRCDRHFDTIHVRITASAISYNEDLTTEQRVSGNSDQTPVTFTEIWSFSRRPGARTHSSASVLQGQCPNCGGPVTIVDRAECPQCQSMVNSGQYDWVLSEITQNQEWVVPMEGQNIPGWNELQKQDPGLNLQHIEDRASVMFWRCLMAVYFDDIHYAAPILDRQRSGLPELWDRSGEGFWKTPAVGVVEVQECITGSDDGFDRMSVMVRWSAKKATGKHRNPELQGTQRIYTHVLTLKRRQGVQSNADQAFASFHCNGCGASIDFGKSADCGFCGSVLNDGSGDWILEEVSRRSMLKNTEIKVGLSDQQRSVERLEAVRLRHDPELIAALSRILMVDGQLDQSERTHIETLALSRGVQKDQLETILATAVSTETPMILPQNKVQADAFMNQLVRAALIDGRVKLVEYRLLKRAGQQIGWSAADLKYALAKNRKEIYQQAKKIIRDQRRKSAQQSDTPV